MSLILVGGGSRSGKSRYALELARSRGNRLAFFATAQAGDYEMADRIRRHREERGPDFTTIEEPIDLAGRIAAEDGHFDAVVIDCLTIWLSNLMLSGAPDLDRRVDSLLSAGSAASAAVVLVTNEVGCGIVPENVLAREFRDRAGILNQRAGAAAREVYWMVFGVPLKVK
jgi:adenosylcobinamide kinase / adenosylcobinamide-phosphate guanylyltransferase